MKSFSKKPRGVKASVGRTIAHAACPIYGTTSGNVRIVISTKAGTRTYSVHPLALLMSYRLAELAQLYTNTHITHSAKEDEIVLV